MTWYGTEQLARQRRDQFANEARGGNLVRLAGGVPSASTPRVGPAPLHRVLGLMNRLGGAMVVGVTRSMRQPRGAPESAIDNRVIGSRDA
jgi:hypothetical protein